MWERLPSRSRPGKYRFVNLQTQQSFRKLPEGAKLTNTTAETDSNTGEEDKKVTEKNAASSLPHGDEWKKVPSRSRPGSYSYLNVRTGQRVRTIEACSKENMKKTADLSSWLAENRQKKKENAHKKPFGAREENVTPSKPHLVSYSGAAPPHPPAPPVKAKARRKDEIVGFAEDTAIEWLPGEKKALPPPTLASPETSKLVEPEEVQQLKPEKVQLHPPRNPKSKSLLRALAQDLLQQVRDCN